MMSIWTVPPIEVADNLYELPEPEVFDIDGVADCINEYNQILNDIGEIFHNYCIEMKKPSTDKERGIMIIRELVKAGLTREEIFATVESPQKKDGKPNPHYIRAGRRCLEGYLAAARTQIAESYKEDKEEFKYRVGLHLSRLDDLYKRCYNAQDYKTCVTIIRDTNTFLGLNQINISIGGSLSATHIPNSLKTLELAQELFDELDRTDTTNADGEPTE